MDYATPLRSDGFRERGPQVTRLETFVGAAFALVAMFWWTHNIWRRRYGLPAP
jgi:hypothetical protein